MTTETQENQPSSKRVKRIGQLDVKNFFSWMSYDVANTFYAGGILQLMVLTWVLVKGQQNGLSYSEANAIFNITLSVASILMAVMLPILGSLSDVLNERKRFILVFTAISLITTYLFAISNNIYMVLLMFAISMICYQWAQVFYDSQLQGVAPPGREAQLSSIAVAVGYLGGGVVILYSLFQASNQPNANPAKGALTLGYFPDLVYVIIGGFFIFSLPMIFVKEIDWHNISAETIGDTIDIEDNPSLWEIVKSSFKELGDTFRTIKDENLGMFFYIIAYFIIADFANLIVLINTTYLRDGLNLTETQVIYMSIVFGASIVLLSYFVGRVADKYGAKRSFQLVGVLWMFSLSMMIIIDLPITIGGLTIHLPIWSVYFLAVLIGPAFSGVWISQRQMVLELVPSEQEVGRYFGLTKFSGKISSSLGPLLWGFFLFYGETSLDFTIAGSYRFAILGMALILLVGFLILHFKVPNKHTEFKERKAILMAALDKMN